LFCRYAEANVFAFWPLSRGERLPLTRERIIETALGVIDEDGFQALRLI
jgi:hypothetical protein